MIFKFILFIFMSAFLISTIAAASMPEKAYKEALQLAEQKVLHKKLAESESQALSSALVKLVYGRYYREGDQWDVVAWRKQSTMMRMTGELQHLENNYRLGGMFHYEVLHVNTGIHPEVTLQITQVQSDGLKIVDPRVSHLILKMNDELIQGEKTYFFRGNNAGIPVSPNGLHSSLSQLELFPLDVPDISTADRRSNAYLPDLPPKIQNFSTTIGYKPDLSKCLWFEQDDFFGRPIQILWQHGDPWPSYMKTPGGIALLVRKKPTGGY